MLWQDDWALLKLRFAALNIWPTFLFWYSLPREPLIFRSAQKKLKINKTKNLGSMWGTGEGAGEWKKVQAGGEGESSSCWTQGVFFIYKIKIFLTIFFTLSSPGRKIHWRQKLHIFLCHSMQFHKKLKKSLEHLWFVLPSNIDFFIYDYGPLWWAQGIAPL